MTKWNKNKTLNMGKESIWNKLTKAQRAPDISVISLMHTKSKWHRGPSFTDHMDKASKG
jgi:hypothetical protein